MFFTWVRKNRKRPKPNRNWKNVARTKHLTVFNFGNSEIRHFWYHSQDLWSTTLVISVSLRDPGKGSSCRLTIEGQQLQPSAARARGVKISTNHNRKVRPPATDPWHSHKLSRNYRQYRIRNPATSGPITWQVIAPLFCVTIRLSYAFFFPFFLVACNIATTALRRECPSSKMNPPLRQNCRNSSESPWGFQELHKFLEINTWTIHSFFYTQWKADEYMSTSGQNSFA